MCLTNMYFYSICIYNVEVRYEFNVIKLHTYIHVHMYISKYMCINTYVYVNIYWLSLMNSPLSEESES